MTMKSEAKLMSDINSHLQRLCYGTLHRLFTCNGSMLAYNTIPTMTMKSEAKLMSDIKFSPTEIVLGHVT